MQKIKQLSLVSFISLSSAIASQAQTIVDWIGGSGNLWETADNWSSGVVPNSNTIRARFNLATDNIFINITEDRTINRYIDGGAGAGITHSLYGVGTLTIDVNNTEIGQSIAIDNATTGDGGTFRIGNGHVRISNSLGTVSTLRNFNSAGNRMLFDTGSRLTLDTLLRTVPGSGGRIDFNGTFLSSAANLQIGSTNAFFGEGHDSTAFGRDIVLLGNSRLTIDGGSVLSAGQRFQVNGNAELALNGANAVNGANITLGGSNNLILGVNASQGTMGQINIADGTLTINLSPSVSALAFANSSALDWGSGSIQINGFREGVIRFGTDAGGLTEAQLAAIGDGSLFLTSNGFLTTGLPGEDPEAPVLSISQSGGNVVVTCPSVAGFDYILVYSTDLNDPWLPIETKAGTGSELTFMSLAPSVGGRIFYRVEVRPALAQ